MSDTYLKASVRSNKYGHEGCISCYRNSDNGRIWVHGTGIFRPVKKHAVEDANFFLDATINFDEIDIEAEYAV